MDLSLGRSVVHAADAPAPVGPYSQAIHAQGMIYCSGQVPLDPATGALVTGDVTAQTLRVLANLDAVLTAAGSSRDAIVKTTIFLTDMNDFAAVNAAYGGFFSIEPPARTTIGVAALPLGAKVEIEAIALAR